jgi:exonuclease III
VNIFEVRDAFLALPHDQQQTLIADWFRLEALSKKEKRALKVAATERPAATQATEYSRDGLPYDERETEACDALLLQGFNNEEAARWFDKNRYMHRTHKAWTWFATKRRAELKAKGELK